MRSATRIMTRTFGILIALGGLEHGIGEMLQGNAAPGGLLIQSWPGPGAAEILNGEPALTIIPNLFAAGIVTVLVSLAFLVWTLRVAKGGRGAPGIALLSIVLLLVGGGFGPPLLGLLLTPAAAKIGAPARWTATLPNTVRRTVAAAWPLSFGASLVAWLAVLPGLPLLAHFAGVNDAGLAGALILLMFASLILAFVSGIVHDGERQASAPPALATAAP